MILLSKIKDVFNVEPVTSAKMDLGVINAVNAYKGIPDWIDNEEEIKTINFAKVLCSEIARLTMMGTKITVDGSAKAEWLQSVVDKIYFNIREWVEYGCVYGTIIMKPSQDGVDLFTPNNYVITEYNGQSITGIVFVYGEKEDSKYYTRFEYHHYIDKDNYTVMNRCFVGESYNSVSEPVDIALTPWNGLKEDANIQGMDMPAYGVFRTPQANNIDINSAVGLPIFHEAMEELKDLDIAYSRNAKEIYDSRRILLLDSDKMIQTGTAIKDYQTNFESNRKAMKLPEYVKNVFGNGKDDFYQEINPNLNTEVRLSGINAILGQIGYKVGFSNGHFVFNENSGIQTATEVEANQQRTIQFIKDVRDRLESCLNGVINGLNMFANLYGLAPAGDYEVIYDFGDITYNYEEEKSRWWGYVVAGKMPLWRYYVKFEGMSEEEAREIEKETQPKQPTLFGSEE